jgi:hypothetical protein
VISTALRRDRRVDPDVRGTAATQKGGEAVRAFARGQSLHTKGDYAAAIAAFEHAYKLKPHHAVISSTALTDLTNVVCVFRKRVRCYPCREMPTESQPAE